MSILKIEGINFISSSSSAIPAPAIASQSPAIASQLAIATGGSSRAGQRRFRTETLISPAALAVPDNLREEVMKLCKVEVLCNQKSELVLKIDHNLWRDNLSNIPNHDYWYPNKNQSQFRAKKSEALREHVHLYMNMHEGIYQYHYNLLNAQAAKSSSPEIFFTHFEWINDSSFINSSPLEQADIYFNQLLDVNDHRFVDHLIKPTLVLDAKGEVDYIEGKSFLPKQGRNGIYYRLYILPIKPTEDNLGNLHHNVYFILFKSCYKPVCSIMVADILNSLDSK